MLHNTSIFNFLINIDNIDKNDSKFTKQKLNEFSI